ncbi:TPA: type-F conjugative transfer system protein TraW [Legionella pneumophila]|nr:type-F conjugative transfer system protein TraW [Legionella pneumophila]HCU5995183.1 type-F conjugative transfer system protein TraW [Legionella pneumophila]
MRAFLSMGFLLLWCSSLGAKSYGVVGEVFPVAEKSFLALIEERLKTMAADGSLETLNQRWVQTVANHANRPQDLGLKRALRSTTHDYVPEVILSQDIKDASGRVLFPRGTQVNGLEQLPAYRPCWLFFNADDKAQILWAQKQQQRCKNPKFILTGGAVKDAEEALQAAIYFDQAGRITRMLSVMHVPAKVVRKGKNLVIVEQAIKESGDVL